MTKRDKYIVDIIDKILELNPTKHWGAKECLEDAQTYADMIRKVLEDDMD